MKEVVIKLSEIETTAKHIMDDAQRQKDAMTSKLQQQIAQYDEESNRELQQQIDKIRATLEQKKEEQISKLQTETTHFFSSLDDYYKQNHQKLAEEIYQQIIK